MPRAQPNQPQSPPAPTPTPEDPRENMPVQDPPVHPEHDQSEVRLNEEKNPEGTLFDENKAAR